MYILSFALGIVVGIAATNIFKILMRKQIETIVIKNEEDLEALKEILEFISERTSEDEDIENK